MVTRSKNVMFDAELVLEDGAAAKTATGVGEKNASPAEALVGPEVLGDWAEGADAQGVFIVDVSAIDAGNGDETYEIVLEGSIDGTFADAVEIACITVDRTITAPKRYTRPFRLWNGEGDTDQAYIKVRSAHTLGGTTPSITYKARVGQDTLNTSP